MVFWKTFPLYYLLHAKLTNKVFESQVFDKEPIISPTGTEAILIQSKQKNEIKEICTFLKNNFGNPPNTPILDIPKNVLIMPNDLMLLVRDIDKNIVGCVRYHYIGKFITANSEDMYVVDCFCIHKKWRRKGLGDYLLTQLHIYVNTNNITPHNLFLKEGPHLSIINAPLYSGIYVYKQLTSHQSSDNIVPLTVMQAYNIMDIFRQLDSGIFIVRNIKSTNQVWKLWKKDTYKVLACFQDAYQRFEKDGKMNRIGWIIGWIESPNMTDKYREEASKELSDTMYPEYDYIWTNREWIGSSKLWKIDGPFHWYAYQWTTCVNIKKSYCILN